MLNLLQLTLQERFIRESKRQNFLKNFTQTGNTKFFLLFLLNLLSYQPVLLQ